MYNDDVYSFMMTTLATLLSLALVDLFCIYFLLYFFYCIFNALIFCSSFWFLIETVS